MARFGARDGLHPQTAALMRGLAGLHRPVTLADVGRWSGKSGRLAEQLTQRLRDEKLLLSLPLKGAYLVAAGRQRVDALTIFRAWLALHGPEGQLTEGAMRCEAVNELLHLPIIEIDVLARYSSDSLERAQDDICKRASRRGVVMPRYQVRRVKRLWQSRLVDGIPVSMMVP